MNAAWFSTALLSLTLLASCGASLHVDKELAHRIEPQGGTILTKQSGSGTTFEADARSRWPGLRIEPTHPADAWDLTGKTHITLPVTNHTSAPLTIHVRVDGPQNSLTYKYTVTDDDPVTLKVPLIAAGPIELEGIQNIPSGVATSGLNVSEIKRLIVFVDRSNPPKRFTIGSPQPVHNPSIDQPPPLDRFFPFIDTFGQYRHAIWPGKIAAGETLSHEEDLQPVTPQGPKPSGRHASGRFRVEKIDDTWWLIDPQGQPFWSHGINVVSKQDATRVTGREHYFDRQSLREAEDEIDFPARNLRLKYGEAWQSHYLTHLPKRLKAWGMNTLGLWSDREVLRTANMPYVDWLYYRSPRIQGTGMVDMWAPEFAGAVEAAARKLSDSDPLRIGVFVDNELPWTDAPLFVTRVLAAPADQPARQAFIGWLKSRYGTIEALRRAWRISLSEWHELDSLAVLPAWDLAYRDAEQFFMASAERYFSIVQSVIDAADKQTLYLCSRFNGRFPIPEQAAARYCDVLSFNLYRRSVKDFSVSADVPVLVSEFHFGTRERGFPGPGLVEVEDREARYKAYLQYGKGALSNRNIIGMHWFQYRDEPATGRKQDGENYQIGFVDVTDRPYTELTQASTAIGTNIYRWRGRLPRSEKE